MLLIVVTVHDGANLDLNAPTMKSLQVKIPTNIETKQSFVTFYRGEEIKTLDCGDEAAAWLSQYLLGTDSGLRLGYHDASHLRDITVANKELVDYYENLTNESSGLYSFLTSVLLVNEASVDDLIKRMDQSTVTVNNFRANLIVDAYKVAPYSEDEWEWIKIGDVVMRNVKECTRCILTTIDPISATRTTDREPLKTLAKYRVSDGPEKLPVMGIHLEVRKTGFLNVGDTVFITRRTKI